MSRNAFIGSVVWCGLLIASVLHRLDLDWIELLFLFAPLVVVPLGLELTICLDQSLALSPPERIARLIQLPCALSAAASFIAGRGLIAATLAGAWLLFCLFLALSGAIRLYRGALRSMDSTLPAVALVYPGIGGMWLVASRLGLTPMNFQEPIVLLTAVHFHYAGFAAPILARSSRRALASGEMPALVSALVDIDAVAVLAGPGTLAAGFVIGPRVKLAAAVILAIGGIGLALCFLAALPCTSDRIAKTLVGLAAFSVIFSMVLAGFWAVGEYPLQPFVHLSEMARFHGTANAFGFTFCGVVGWLRGANAMTRSERSSQNESRSHRRNGFRRPAPGESPGSSRP